MSVSIQKTNSLDIKEEPLADAVKNEKVETKIKFETNNGVNTNTNEPVVELLGSVTTQNCPGVRTSARVIQKMKQDSIRPATPPPPEKENKPSNDKPVQRTPSQARSTRELWTNLERNLFFDALNEFGKDFDAIATFINTKLKRKNVTDLSFKTKEQIRHIYYQQFHKVTKYVKFSDEVKKPAQELYALINYGEMRRRLQFMSDKNCMKIKDLIYKGHVTVRNKGKNIRIRTPSCKALRKLNQLEDWLEDIKLPLKVEVSLRPSNLTAYGHVQAIAQNPLVNITVPLQKKLINIIKTFENKWKSAEGKLAEEVQKLKPSTSTEQVYTDPPLRIIPHHNSIIHRPIVSIAEFLSSYNICLNSYEKRIGVKMSSETLCHEKLASKRQRCDSGSEKRSPENKKIKAELNVEASASEDVKAINVMLSPPIDVQNTLSDLSVKTIMEIGEELQELLSDKTTEELILNVDTSPQPQAAVPTAATPHPITDPKPPVPMKKAREIKSVSRRKDHKKDVHLFRPLVSEEVLKKIRKGWTAANAGDITIGDLYVVFGADSKLMLEYHWMQEQTVNSISNSIATQKPNGMPYNLTDCAEDAVVQAVSSSQLGNKLKHLLLIANYSDRVRKRQCSCGHSCEKNIRSRFENDLAAKSFVSNKTFPTNGDNALFRQPMAPFRRPMGNADFSTQQSTTVGRLRQFKQRGGMANSRKVVVQRILPCQRGLNQSYDVMEVSDLKNNHADSIRMQMELCSPDNEMQSSMCQDDDGQTTGLMNVDESVGISNTSVVNDENCNIEAKHDNDIEEGCSVNADFSLGLDELTNDSTFSIPPLSPFHILRDVTSESRWMEENINDFSMSSLLNHLDAVNSSRDETTGLSVLNESSIDYITKFAEITASMQHEEKDL